MVNLDRFDDSCNTLADPIGRICVLNQTKNVNLSVFNMIKRINESKSLGKHISCKCKYKFDGRKCKSDQSWNKGKC